MYRALAGPMVQRALITVFWTLVFFWMSSGIDSILFSFTRFRYSIASLILLSLTAFFDTVPAGFPHTNA